VGILNFLRATRSHRRRHSVSTDPPCATLLRTIRLLDRNDEDFRANLEIALVPRGVSNDGRISGDKDFLFSVLVFYRFPIMIVRVCVIRGRDASRSFVFKGGTGIAPRSNTETNSTNG
jgi:hypothetical protein